MRPLLLAMATAGLLAAQGALAADYPVTNLNDSGAGSLRDAVASANATANVPDRIIFTGAALSGTITLTSGEIAVTDRLSIEGPNADDANQITISGNNSSRVFSVADGLDVDDFGLTLTNLHLTAGNGKALSTDPAPGPGGCIRADSALELNNSIVSGCTAANAGGGIYVSDMAEMDNGAKYDANLALMRSTLTGNTVSCQDQDGGKYACAGGGAAVSGGAYAVYSVISNNAVVTGNGDYNADVMQYGGGLLAQVSGVFASTVTGNSLSGNPNTVDGDLVRFGGGVAGMAVVSYDSTIDNNTISASSGTVSGSQYLSGGGLAAIGWGVVLQSTISGNSVPPGGEGGGALLGTMGKYSVISNSTINRNSGASGLLIGAYGGSAEGVYLNSTIIANTIGGVDLSCTLTPTCTVEGGDNLVESSTGVAFVAPPLTLDPQLAPLANNGGFVAGAAGAPGTGSIRTHALLATSPAIDKGNIELDINALEYDQRGPYYLRVLGSRSDIGAYEGGGSVSIPTLSASGMGLLSALLGFFGWRWRKRS